MDVDVAQVSLLGNREENQDSVAVIRKDDATLLIAIDGMGGHAGGAEAARLSVEVIAAEFDKAVLPVLDPQGFMHCVIARAHAALVGLGDQISVEARPRATCAMCLVQDGYAYWGHVGDSRIYHLRNGLVSERSRDHSHVEVLLQEGLITEDEVQTHPMRNFVECCLGGDSALPSMSITPYKRLDAGDVLLVCSDGFWSGLSDAEMAAITAHSGPISASLDVLADQAVKATSPHSDNTSAAALRFIAHT
ncbi:MAG: protein phosphatase 2C domain-containing protein [Gammaproteobacteria bacterium]|nr:protein phosphatase 2C domain-containing protein [Gammaproteobacteria bacterium]